MVYMVLTLKYSIQCWDIERPACAIQHETEVCQNHEGRTLQTYDKNELNHIKTIIFLPDSALHLGTKDIMRKSIMSQTA